MAIAEQAGAGAEPRIPLSRERVLRAAIALADEAGFELFIGQAVLLENVTTFLLWLIRGRSE